MRKIHKTIVRICTVVTAVLIPASSTILTTAKSNDQNNAGTLNSINSIDVISTYASLESLLLIGIILSTIWLSVTIGASAEGVMNLLCLEIGKIIFI